MTPTSLKLTPLMEEKGVDALRQILARSQQRDIAYEEAQELGNALIEFFQVLAAKGDDGSEA